MVSVTPQTGSCYPLRPPRALAIARVTALRKSDGGVRGLATTANGKPRRVAGVALRHAHWTKERTFVGLLDCGGVRRARCLGCDATFVSILTRRLQPCAAAIGNRRHGAASHVDGNWRALRFLRGRHLLMRAQSLGSVDERVQLERCCALAARDNCGTCAAACPGIPPPRRVTRAARICAADATLPAPACSDKARAWARTHANTMPKKGFRPRISAGTAAIYVHAPCIDSSFSLTTACNTTATAVGPAPAGRRVQVRRRAPFSCLSRPRQPAVPACPLCPSRRSQSKPLLSDVLADSVTSPCGCGPRTSRCTRSGRLWSEGVPEMCNNRCHCMPACSFPKTAWTPATLCPCLFCASLPIWPPAAVMPLRVGCDVGRASST